MEFCIAPLFGRARPTGCTLLNAVKLLLILLSCCLSRASDQKSAATNDPYCAISPEALKFVSPGTLRMAQLLGKLAQDRKPEIDPFLNGDRAELFRQKWLSDTNGNNGLAARMSYAIELMNAGNTKEAVRQFQGVEQDYLSHPMKIDSRFRGEVHYEAAVAYLRLGEQQNCLSNHTSESCILPIKGGGIYKEQGPTRTGIKILESHLSARPNDLRAEWLLNIGYMTLGEYPAKVPPKWLIPPTAFASDYDIKPFPDIAAYLGLDTDDCAGGTIAEDFDGDGLIDLLTSEWLLTGQMHYFHNNGNGTFSDKTMEAGLSGLVGGLNLIQGDYNNDGLPDVIVLRGGWQFQAGNVPDSLLRNDGNNHFTDVTEEAGLLKYAPNQTAVWLDFNGDGLLDIYFGYESSPGNEHPCQLFRNNGDGTFTECAEAAGVANVGFVKAVVSGDFNNDGQPDLYLSRMKQPNVLYRNDGPRDPKGGAKSDWKFTDVSEPAGVTEPKESFPAWFFDYDNDGWEDMFVCGYTRKNVGDIAADYLGLPCSSEKMRLYHNNRDGTFKDVSAEAHLAHVVYAMGANFGDFDNDGWLDFYLGTGDPDLATLTPNRAFRNAGGAYFQDVTSSGGLGHLQKGHGISFADFDNDGDQDIYHSVGGAYEGDFYRNVLFENPGHGNHWIKLKLIGEQSNRVGIGARIKVITTENGKERQICRTVGSGGSFGANPLMQEIGLGKSSEIKRVEIFWPVTGKRQILSGLAMDTRYRIHEGASTAEEWKLTPFAFDKTTLRSAPHHAHAEMAHP